jgi:hypothetical integral membrane protein (TIGR02206 family)
MVQPQSLPAPGGETTIFTTLTPFTLMHVVVAGTSLLLMVLAAQVGLRLRRRDEQDGLSGSNGQGKMGREWQLRRAWCVFVLLWQLAATAWWCSPGRFVASVSLPLHICDLGGFLVPLALWTQHRWLRSLLYFWGIGLSTQALVTPVEDAGLGQVQFWLFWVGHTQIIGSAVYDIVVLRFRPSWRDYVSATIMTVAYAAIIIPVNVHFKFNYGYIGKDLPEKRTILNELPPWPWRLLALFAIMQGAYLVIWLVWPLGRWGGKKRRSDGAT